MKKLKILKLTDATCGDMEYYSKQLELLTGGKHYSETDYFLTTANYVVDIDNDIDINDINVMNAIVEGAVVTTMFYVADDNFSRHIYDFEPEAFCDGVEYGDDHGVIFELESDGENYEKYINMEYKISEKLSQEVLDKTMHISKLNSICIDAVNATILQFNLGLYEVEKDEILIEGNMDGDSTFGVINGRFGYICVGYDIIDLETDSNDFNSIVKVTSVNVL